MQMLSEEIDGINLEALIVLCSLCFLFYKKQHVMLRKIEWIPFIIAIMFSGFTLIGISYSAIGNWDFVFGGKK